MLKGNKYRLYPNKKQVEALAKAFGCCRYIYNKALEYCNKHYEETGEHVFYNELANTFLKEEKKNNSWLKEPYSQSLQQSCMHLEDGFKRFFKHETEHPTFHSKNGEQSVHYPQHVKFINGCFVIPKLGHIRPVLHRPLEGEIRSAVISKTPTGEYYISVLTDDGKPSPEKVPIDEDSTIGIDLGIKNYVAFSNGENIENPKYLNKTIDKIKRQSKLVSRKKKGSKNRRKASQRLARSYRKITRQRNDFLHKLSFRIVSENQTIVLETLNIKGMMKNHQLAKSIADASWAKLNTFITYKAEWQGKNVIHIPQFEPTTKVCSNCGFINDNLTLADREWTCPVCGAVHLRDTNAAIVIKNVGLKMVLGSNWLPNRKQLLPARPVRSKEPMEREQ